MDKEQQQAAFDAWYDAHDPRTPQSPFEKELARKAWDAAFDLAQAQNDQDLRALAHERARADRLQRILDTRPAFNAGLPQTYIEWSQSIYIMDAAHARETPQ